MKFDSIIIGGGLSGLTCGIKLAQSGQKCAIVSSGQSALHFFSGSFDLLGYKDGEQVTNPIDAISSLDANHPYSIIGKDNVKRIADNVPEFFKNIGINLVGNCEKNHFRITPLGIRKPTWLTLDELGMMNDSDSIEWKSVCVINVAGFLDMHTSFIAAQFERMGCKCEIKAVSIPELDKLRSNPTEMRSSNIAKALNFDDALSRFAKEVNEKCGDCEAVILPALFGLYTPEDTTKLKSLINKPVALLPTLPPSVPGIRMQIMLRNYFQQLGGVYFLGDTVSCGDIRYSKVIDITTINHADITLEANNYVLATGSFFSHGLVAKPNQIEETVFGLDVIASKNRADWFDKSAFEKQQYMSYGVTVDKSFNALFKGNVLKNLYAVGSVIGGFDPIKEACGAGISIISAMYVAEQITKK